MHFRYIDPLWFEVTADAEVIDALDRKLTYDDSAALELVRRHKRAHWFEAKYGAEAHQEKLEELQAAVKVRLLKRTSATTAEVFTGFRRELLAAGLTQEGGRPQAPASKSVAWAKPPHKLRYYQEDAVQALLSGYHGVVSAPTGSGKTAIILSAARELGLRTLIMTPTESIATQLYNQAVEAFGAKKVGMFGDGKKDSKKDIVVGIGASLTRVKPDSEHWAKLADRPLFITDEAHTLGADSFANVAQGLCRNSVYRFALSATPFRNDGSELLLKGLIGETLYDIDMQRLVQEGYLSAGNYFGVEYTSKSGFVGPYEDMVAIQFWENKGLHQTVANFANNFYATTKKPVLILIDHIEQFLFISPYLKYEHQFAHGAISDPKMKSRLEERWWKADNTKIVKAFNAGEVPILIGTSCIGVGTDLQPTGTILYLQAGQSEVKVRQAIGRGTRVVPGKNSFTFVDFGINIPGLDNSRNPLMRHFRTRLGYYDNPKILKA